FEEFDHIYVMDSSNYKDVTKLAPDNIAKAKVKLMMDEVFPGQNIDVPDPYWSEQDGFDKVYDMLDEACTLVANKLLKEHS
ncbi:MAG: low molecular weight phosphotyrosine protein phosphatase, partial [Flavobacterium sp.]